VADVWKQGRATDTLGERLAVAKDGGEQVRILEHARADIESLKKSGGLDEASAAHALSLIDERLGQLKAPAEPAAADTFETHGTVAEVDAALAKALPGVKIKSGLGPHGNMRLEIEVGGKKGYLSYALGSDRLLIDKIELDPSMRGKKISNLLYERVMLEHPEIKALDGTLDQVNLDAYYKALHGPPARTHLEALKETPAYKARAKAGFTRIDEDLSIQSGAWPRLVTWREEVKVREPAAYKGHKAPPAVSSAVEAKVRSEYGKKVDPELLSKERVARLDELERELKARGLISVGESAKEVASEIIKACGK
jgi:hypothetical protein